MNCPKCSSTEFDYTYPTTYRCKGCRHEWEQGVKSAIESPVVKILQECIALHDAKSSDYDHPTEHDGLGNFRRSERIGVQPWLGAMTRMMDKWSRLETLTLKIQRGEGPAVKNETFEDTLMDNLVYSAIVLALYREWRSKQDSIKSRPSS